MDYRQLVAAAITMTRPTISQRLASQVRESLRAKLPPTS
jgi:hypothetical protein